MRLHLAEKSSLKLPFVIGGVVVGAVASAWYIYRNVARQTLGYVPDPIWTRFVNVALIMFVAIYVANLLRRVVEFVLRKGERS